MQARVCIYPAFALRPHVDSGEHPVLHPSGLIHLPSFFGHASLYGSMPSTLQYEDASEHAAFLPDPVSRSPPWRSQVGRFSRRAAFGKQTLLFAVVLALASPFLIYIYHTTDVPDASPFQSVDVDDPLSDVLQALPPKLSGDIVPDLKHNTVRPHHGHKIPSDQHAASQPIAPPLPEPVVFALIAWGEVSASEGAILIKVCAES